MTPAATLRARLADAEREADAFAAEQNDPGAKWTFLCGMLRVLARQAIDELERATTTKERTAA